ncbi:MAG: hypothetical protein GY928_01910 [Colwellia sp.]|nr:hypothetical protein [Colwellia sp.]
MQDAINTISGIINCFPEIYKIGIVHENKIIVYYATNKFSSKSFKNAIELLKWCEDNLEQKQVKDIYFDGCGKDICGHCNMNRTKKGHDGCIGELPNVRNACCGHGDDTCAYVQFNHDNYKKEPNKYRISGKEALNYISENREVEN